MDEIKILSGTLRRYRAALEFYASPLSWTQRNQYRHIPALLDKGNRARNALLEHDAPAPFYPETCEKDKED